MAELRSEDPESARLATAILAIAEEHWERIIRGQPPDVRQVLDMLRQGHTQREVADRFGCHPKSIQRLLEKLRPRVDQP